MSLNCPFIKFCKGARQKPYMLIKISRKKDMKKDDIRQLYKKMECLLVSEEILILIMSV